MQGKDIEVNIASKKYITFKGLEIAYDSYTDPKSTSARYDPLMSEKTIPAVCFYCAASGANFKRN